MVPYSFTITSHIIVTIMFSLMVYLGVMTIMIREHGFHALSVFLPAGAPFALYPLLIAIELISNVMRIVSLSVRLFANMMAGHILLKVLLGFAWTMMMAGGVIFFLHLIPMGVVFVLLFLETAVAVIQAYVFATLTCIYLNEAINLH
jgi:ATP synthase subunit 6